MVQLTTTQRISIMVEESDLMQNNKHLLIMYRQRFYDGTSFRQIDDSSKKLYANLIDEFNANKAAALDEFDRLHDLYAPKPSGNTLGDQLQEMMLKVLAEQSADKVLDIAKPLIEKHVIETFGVLPQIHEVHTPTKTTQFEGITHEKFEDVLELVNLDIPVFLTGPAGTGKNVICKQVAKALNLDFYFTNAVTQEYKLTGFIDANGTYQETEFYKAFKYGGLFMLDEIDASIPEVLVILNAAIANRYFDFPNGKIEAHENFRVIAAGNTFGTGADIEYSGRYQLDAASLDRFALIDINYSPAIENAVTNGNKELCEFARLFREITNEAGIRCLCTYRALERIAKLENVFNLRDAIKMSLTKGLNKDDVKIIAKGFVDRNYSNKYTAAL